MDEVVDAGNVVTYEVDSPQTARKEKLAGSLFSISRNGSESYPVSL